MYSINKMIVTAVIAAMLLLQGCSSLNSSKTDVDQLEAETAEFIAEVEFGLQTEQTALLLRYVNEGQIPEADEYVALWDELMAGMDAIANYSIASIDVAEDEDDAARKEKLIANLQQLYELLGVLPTLGPDLADVDLDAIVIEATAAEKFIDAARIVQKGIDPAVTALDDLTIRAADALDVSFDKMLLAIDDYHAEAVHYRIIVDQKRSAIFAILELLDVAYRDNDKAVWNELLAMDRELQETLSGSSPTVANIDKAQDVLLAQLAVLDGLRISIGPDIQLYEDELVELRALAQGNDGALKIARFAIDAWGQGHEDFVEGRKTGFAAITNAVAAYAIEKGRRKIF